MIRTASIDGPYRYLLTREWGLGPTVAFTMLNPSKANALWDDPSSKKCVTFAQAWGYGALYLVNLFAYRATNPRDLKLAGYPVGPENDHYLESAFASAHLVVCAWGANARNTNRPAEVLAMIRRHRKPHALRLLADGTPEHVLYLPSTCSPKPL